MNLLAFLKFTSVESLFRQRRKPTNYTKNLWYSFHRCYLHTLGKMIHFLFLKINVDQPGIILSILHFKIKIVIRYNNSHFIQLFRYLEMPLSNSSRYTFNCLYFLQLIANRKKNLKCPISNITKKDKNSRAPFIRKLCLF